MADVGMKELLQAGVHFGHQTSRWNPKMRKYIFAERSGIYLLDLRKTLRQLGRARQMIRETVEEGRGVLFVCTKPQLAEVVRKEAERCGAYHVTERWVGGLLTNFQTIKKNIRRLKELEQGLEEGHFDYYTKKEQILLDRERQKLDRYLSGIKDMTKLPGLVFVVDAKREEIAVKEADRLEIPVLAIADTNADPDRLTIPIPGNDDALRAVSLITRNVADAVEAARREVPEAQVRDEGEVYTYSSDAGEQPESGEAPRRRKKRPRRRPKPEVIARARKEKDEDEEVEETSAGPTVEPETQGPARAEAESPEGGASDDEEVPEASVPDAEAEAAEDEGVEAADLEERGAEEEQQEEEAVAVSSAAGGEDEDEEEAPPS